MRSKSIGQNSIQGRRRSAGTGYVIIPKDENRDKFIKQCYRTGTISMLLDNNNEVLHKVKISSQVLDEIEFPESNLELGSLVCWVNYYRHNKPVVIARLFKNDDSQERDENSFNLERSTDDASVSIVGRAKDGKLYVSVEGDASEVVISVKNSDEDGKMRIEVAGDSEVEVTGTASIKANKINFGEGAEPLLLGNTTQSELQQTINLLQALLNVINGAPIPEPGSGAPSALQTALSSAITGQSLGDFGDDIKSELTNTD